MKKSILKGCFFALVILLGAGTSIPSFAEEGCSAGPCEDGSTCSASGGGSWMTCACICPHGGDELSYAYCRSGGPDLASHNGTFPVLNGLQTANTVTIVTNPNATAYHVKAVKFKSQQ